MFTLTAAVGAVGALGGLSATGLTMASAASNNATAWKFFVGKGLSEAQAAGLIGNFIVESGADPINPAAKQFGGGPGRGIAQWEGSRRTALFNYAASRGLAWSSLQLQLDFVWREFSGPESRALSKLKATSTPADAAVAVRKYYERPSAHADQARIRAAKLIFDRYANGTVPPPATESKLPVLKYRAKGSAVKTAQYLLRGNGRSLAIDGSFGPGTLAAVKGYQKAKRLDVDGVVGPKTWMSLLITLRKGSKGDAVRALQSELKGSGHSLSVDGSFGPATLSAVRGYQKANGLAVDGVVGPITWASLID